jgi:hypothetical protein
MGFESPLRTGIGLAEKHADVRCWHKADIPVHSADVRFWG